MTTTYLKCSECSGEIPFEIEWTDDGAADIYGAQSYPVAILDVESNLQSHDPGCSLAYVNLDDTLTEMLEQQAAQSYGYGPEDD